MLRLLSKLWLQNLLEKYGKLNRGNFRIVSTDSIYAKLNCQKIFNQSEINNWEKVDINNDGLTDLLFIPHYYGYSQYSIIDEGNDNFKLTRFNIDFDICEYIKPIKVQDKNEYIEFER